MCEEVFPSLELIPTPIYHAYNCEREKISLALLEKNAYMHVLHVRILYFAEESR
jgi:hypothetical protein